MCWVHEWARAFNNLNWVKIHLERAKIILERAPECEKLIELTENSQTRLKSMIETYGIFKTHDAESLVKSRETRLKSSSSKGKIETKTKISNELSGAIIQLDWAKIHVERAKIKVDKRALKTATKECEQLIEIIENAQMRLKSLIELYVTKDVDSLINNRIQRKKFGRVEQWVKTN